MSKIILYRIFFVSILFFMSLTILTVQDVKAQEEDIWTRLAPMQQPRGALGVTVANDKIYAIGGTAGATHSIVKTNEEYNPTTNTWTYKTPMPTPRSHFAITTLENKIYCIGGNTYTLDPYETMLTGINEVYDPLTDSWEPKAPLPTPKKAITANVIDNKIYVVGDQSNEFWMYTPETDQWTQKTPISPAPTRVGGWSCSSAVVNNKLHVVGVGIHVVYDPKNDTWSSESKTPQTPYYGSACATIGINSSKRFYVFGVDGQYWDLSYPDSVSMKYDPKVDSWTTFDPTPTKRVDFGVAVVDDQIYTIGGYTLNIGNNIDASGIVERYTPVGYGLPDSSYDSPEPTPTPTLSPTPTPVSGPDPTPTPTPEPEFPITIAVASAVILSIVVIGIFVYFKKRRS